MIGIIFSFSRNIQLKITTGFQSLDIMLQRFGHHSQQTGKFGIRSIQLQIQFIFVLSDPDISG